MQESKVKFKDPITGSEMNVEPIKWRISLETSQLLSISILYVHVHSTQLTNNVYVFNSDLCVFCNFLFSIVTGSGAVLLAMKLI